jgi:hypothetical protein
MGMSSLGINIRWQPKTSMPKIEGIDLLTNYSGFALADGGYKGITLNLHTKDSYKNKWVSDVELGYGINNALRFPLIL